jgi:hypothetical protein
MPLPTPAPKLFERQTDVTFPDSLDINSLLSKIPTDINGISIGQLIPTSVPEIKVIFTNGSPTTITPTQ